MKLVALSGSCVPAPGAPQGLGQVKPAAVGNAGIWAVAIGVGLLAVGLLTVRSGR